ncbi:transposase, IS4 family [Psychromonas ingrahamii 37]|uniref:Transposase, IS4 family n=1 Tax=Psychromonas ingrahamii (strain DSM 17664 / CCUG 51855 / 37) TaxID=357804 RepID=A1SR28_PSYIN|nr:IS982 family transposase [Psychromonas ingrahamii]ABM01943.1 transposase, IS4 family [Psychromonas ingrahamii 37]
MINLTDTFCDVDDFCKAFIPEWEARLITNGEIKRRRVNRMSKAEIMTIIISFHQSHYRDFKNYYLGYVAKYLKPYFPALLSYTRFIEVMPSVIIPLNTYLTTLFGKPTGIAFIDSTKIAVCHIIRAKRNKVFNGTAKHGKGTMGWFFGFKLHLIVNHLGDILSVKITEGNVDDRNPVPDMVGALSGKLYGDKGYLGKALASKLQEKGVELITNVRKNMKKGVISKWDKAMLSKRYLIETINDQVKNISYVEHTRHRSITGFVANMLGGLIAYCLQKDKPSINLTPNEKNVIIGENIIMA